MSKIWIGAAIGLAVVVGGGTSAHAGGTGRSLVPGTQTVAPGGQIVVTYNGCLPSESVVFQLTGNVVATIPCTAGAAQANFAAPSTPGNYNGAAVPISTPTLEESVTVESVTVESVIAPQGFRSAVGALAPQQVIVPCDGEGECTFQVIVQPPATTTTTTTTTTTVAPTTTAVAAVPPAPTATTATPIPTTAVPAASPALPATGASRSDNTTTIALVLLALGAGLFAVSRFRKGETDG